MLIEGKIDYKSKDFVFKVKEILFERNRFYDLFVKFAIIKILHLYYLILQLKL